MAYQELTQFNSPNYTPGSQVPAVYGMARAVEGVTYHWWGSNADFMSIVNYLCRANGNTSAHTVGEAGRVAWIVDAVNAAWHAGNR
jgi:N-acetyl-anhydromuramyl-L-alanine amidase AmpD